MRSPTTPPNREKYSRWSLILFAILTTWLIAGIGTPSAVMAQENDCDLFPNVDMWYVDDLRDYMTFEPDKESYCEGEVVQVTCGNLANNEIFSSWYYCSNSTVRCSYTAMPATLSVEVFAPDPDSPWYPYRESWWNCGTDSVSEDTEFYCDVPFGVTGGGAAYVNDARVNSIVPETVSFHRHDTLKITTDPFSGWEFSHYVVNGYNIWDAEWNEWPQEGTSPCAVDREVKIHFSPVDNSGDFWVGSWVYPITNATIERDVDKTGYNAGERVRLDCQPDEGYRFVEWKSTFRDSQTPTITDSQVLEVHVDGNSFHECHVEPVERTLNTEVIVFPVNAPSYTDNSLISVSPDTGGVYDHGTHIDLTAARPNVSGQYCALDWYWYVPDVSPDWHLLPNHNQTIGVTMDHDKWFRAEWICSLDEPTPTPTPTGAPTAEPTHTPTATPPPDEEMCSLILNTTGNGSVRYGEYGSTSSATVRVLCGEEMVVVAQPGPGWRFTHFEMERGLEQTTVSVSPYTWTVQDGDSIEAFFEPGADSVYLPAVRR